MRNLYLFFLLCASPGVYASDDLNNVMQHLSDSLLTLIPIVQSHEIDQQAFSTEVGRLQDYVHQAEAHFEDQPVTARVTYKMLKERIDEVSALSHDKSLLTARSVLSESMELCASCHARDRKSRMGFGVSRLHDLDEFQAAEFSFLSRDYESALISYKNFLLAETDEYRRSQALDRILAITTEIYGDPVSAIKMLDDVKLVSDTERFRVKSWKSLFDKLLDSESSLSNPMAHESITEMEQFLSHDWPSIQSFMGWNEQQAYWMLIRRQLNTLLDNKPAEAEIPVLLYWLAVADRSTHFQFHESLSRRYLESCIRDYPGHSYGESCFEEFELLMIVSFSGSGGINMPIEIRQDINELRRLVYAKK